jgi:cyclophilin family peptidyl-prolyl cis-trans isomerase/HEAT repeat protein
MRDDRRFREYLSAEQPSRRAGVSNAAAAWGWRRCVDRRRPSDVHRGLSRCARPFAGVGLVCSCVCVFAPAGAAPAPPASTRLAILQAEDRRAATARDLAVLRAGAHSPDPENARIAVRALGRLERPSVIADILPSLKHPLPEVRAEAANALGQAAHGWKKDAAAAGVDAVARALDARLAVEADADVRAAICDTLGRLPYASAEQVGRAERTLVDALGRAKSISDRLGVAEGAEQLVRQRAVRPPGADLVAGLIDLSTLRQGEATSAARIRRLAVEALIGAAAATDAIVDRTAIDPDAQVRRLAMRAAATPGPGRGPAAAAALTAGLRDESPMVRLEAVRGLRTRRGETACSTLVGALKDRDTHVDLMALDQLAGCGASDEAVAALVRTVNDLSQAESPRGWHRPAHALVALASAKPDRASAALATFVSSSIWQLRLYAARAAAILRDRTALDKLAGDDEDNVREAAIEGLVKVAGHAADAIYVAQLSRRGHQVLRAAAQALAGASSRDAAVPALKSALQRLLTEGHDNSHDARDAISDALTSLGDPTSPALKPGREPHESDLDADDLHRLASPRARVKLRGGGTFELALFTSEAPATVLRFAHLVETGYYNGLTFHRIVPNFVIQGGSPGANEYIGDAWFMRDEVGLWPHVRGAVGISTRGRDTGDGQFFVDLVDNPRLDHEYTVFAQVLNGIDVIDGVLEGDVIETIEIIP